MHVVEPPRPNYFIRSLTNPFAAYAAGFSCALAVYSFGYSDLYPPLEQSTIWFLLGTSAVCALLAATVGNIVNVYAHEQESVEAHFYILTLLLIVFAAEVVYNGGIPLLLLVSGADYNYQDYGIPEVHVAYVGFCYFYAVYWFDLYLIQRRKAFLAFSIIATGTSLMIVNRGAFMITVLALVFVYVQRRGVSRVLLQSFAVLVASILWGFGLLGDLRTHGASGESLILTIGEASDSFVNSSIPTEIFWPYLYISSPLANLQLNMSSRVAPDEPATYFELEFLPDFISKRIIPEGDYSSSNEPQLITPQLAVSTMYGRSFFLMGWLGLTLSFAYFIAISLGILTFLKRSKYFVTACGILSSLAFLNIFDNMFIFVGGILQVFVAIFLHLFERQAVSQASTH